MTAKGTRRPSMQYHQKTWAFTHIATGSILRQNKIDHESLAYSDLDGGPADVRASFPLLSRAFASHSVSSS